MSRGYIGKHALARTIGTHHRVLQPGNLLAECASGCWKLPHTFWQRVERRWRGAQREHRRCTIDSAGGSPAFQRLRGLPASGCNQECLKCCVPSLSVTRATYVAVSTLPIIFCTTNRARRTRVAQPRPGSLATPADDRRSARNTRRGGPATARARRARPRAGHTAPANLATLSNASMSKNIA